MKKIVQTISFWSAFGLMGLGFVAHAAQYDVRFNTATREVSVSGDCGKSEVAVLFKNKKTGEVWGSSNPSCVNGRFSYSLRATDPRLDGPSIAVEVVDGGYRETEKKHMKTDLAPQVVTPAPDQAPSEAPVLALETSSVPLVAADEQSFFESMLASMFNLADVFANGAQQFAVLVGQAIKTEVLAATRIFTHSLALIPGGSITVPDGQDQMSGRGTIAAGATDAFVPNALVASTSKIFVTPVSKTASALAVTQKLDGQGFNVSLDAPAAGDVPFDWMIVNSYATGNPSKSQSAAQVSAPAAPAATVSGPQDSGSGASTTNATATSSDSAAISVATDSPTSAQTENVSVQTTQTPIPDQTSTGTTTSSNQTSTSSNQ